MPFCEALCLVADFVAGGGVGRGGALQDADAAELFAFSQVARSNRRAMLQSAAWRAAAHGRRASWRAVTLDRDTQTQDLNTVLAPVDDNLAIYGPFRVRHICRILDAELRVIDALLVAAPQLRPMYDRMEAAAVAHVQALEDLDMMPSSDEEQ
jgi:hypothetical protein